MFQELITNNEFPTVVSRKLIIHTGMGFMQVSQITVRAALRKLEAEKTG
jgi:DNA-binding GntR family transcriptional regulator